MRGRERGAPQENGIGYERLGGLNLFHARPASAPSASEGAVRHLTPQPNRARYPLRGWASRFPDLDLGVEA